MKLGCEEQCRADEGDRFKFKLLGEERECGRLWRDEKEKEM